MSTTGCAPPPTADQALVEDRCRDLGVPLRVFRLDPGSRRAGESIEMWARRERYRCFESRPSAAAASVTAPRAGSSSSPPITATTWSRRCSSASGAAPERAGWRASPSGASPASCGPSSIAAGPRSRPICPGSARPGARTRPTATPHRPQLVPAPPAARLARARSGPGRADLRPGHATCRASGTGSSIWRTMPDLLRRDADGDASFRRTQWRSASRRAISRACAIGWDACATAVTGGKAAPTGYGRDTAGIAAAMAAGNAQATRLP